MKTTPLHVAAVSLAVIGLISCSPPEATPPDDTASAIHEGDSAKDAAGADSPAQETPKPPAAGIDASEDAPFDRPMPWPAPVDYVYAFEGEDEGPPYVVFDGAYVESVEMGREGGAALKVATAPGIAQSWGGIGIGTGEESVPEDMLSAVPSTDYEASVWLKGLENFAETGIQMHVRDQSGANLANELLPLAAEWAQLRISFRTTPETECLSVHVGKRKGTEATVYLIDDLRVAPIVPVQNSE